MLSKQEAHALFQKLCRITNVKHDPCVEDVFAAAIAQAKNPDLAEEQKRWTYWSAIRKKRPVRCEWVNLGNNDYVQYHDSEWGVPVHDDKVHFEFLILEGAQAGLSWETILKRRAAYEEAFAGFDWKKVANFNQEKIDNLLTSSAIIRNRAKIQSAINNAQAFERVREEFGSFNDYIWQFVNATPLQPNQKMSSKIATTCAEAELMSRDLKKRGFSFVGPTIMYAYMQATGLINDHSPRCFRHKELASY
jgi:DNA-3-methyladenine glycosylase I